MTTKSPAEARNATMLDTAKALAEQTTLAPGETRIEDLQGRLHAHGTSTCPTVRRTP